MRTLLLPLLAIVFTTACQKEITPNKVSDKIDDVSAKVASGKIDICHKGHMISINQSSWPDHQAHGDLLGNCSAVLSTTICDQTWMVKNLDVDHYRNGDPIPQVTDPDAWAALTTGAWCYYFNDPANGAIYGKLYNWYAVNDPRGLAPTGWHVPTDAEWVTLVNCLGGEYIAGGKLKEIGTTHWLDPNIEATNETGFTALPGNRRSNTGQFDPSSASPFLGVFGFWWTTTEYSINSNYALEKYIVYFSGSVQYGADDKAWGNSVRCVRD